MTESVEQHWQLRKAAITSDKGLVATQHYLASDIGADVLRVSPLVSSNPG
ncbi:MAG: hypothetical protein ACPHE0_04665 [Pseudomonadales bacterium]